MKWRAIFKYVTIGLVCILFSACASEDRKLRSQGAETASRAFEIVLEIKSSFLDGDRSKLKELCSETLFAKLSDSMDTFKGKDMEFRMKWVSIEEDGTVNLYISWSEKDKDPADTRIAQFVIGKSPFVARKILRDDPFIR